MGKALVVVQYCHKDIEQAFDLANLIADLEPGFNSHAEILLFNSHMLGEPESNPRVMAVASHLRTKFSKVHTLKCMRRGEGYPGGSNDLWFDLIQQVWTLKRDNRTEADCVFTLEADSLPVRKDWIALLENEWARAGALIVGALSGGENDKHINGNMVIAISLSQRMPGLLGCPANEPWDMYHRQALLQVAKPTALIRNDYRKPSASYADVFGDPNVALIHGIRDGSGRALVRKHVINGEPSPAEAWKPSDGVILNQGLVTVSVPAHVHTVVSEVKEVFPMPVAIAPLPEPEAPQPEERPAPKPKKKAKAAAAA